VYMYLTIIEQPILKPLRGEVFNIYDNFGLNNSSTRRSTTPPPEQDKPISIYIYIYIYIYLYIYICKHIYKTYIQKIYLYQKIYIHT
jgi:hypothetical protein